MKPQHEQMFGCDPAEMMAELTQPLAEYGLTMILTSMLSDAQEMLASGKPDAARNAINRVKFILNEKLPKTYVTPTDVDVHFEVGTLRNLHADTTPGTWHALKGRSRVISGTVSPGGYTGFDVLHCSGRDIREGKRNAAFSAKLHNAAGPLLDAAELVQHVLTKQATLPRDERDAYITERAAATLAALKQSQL